MSAEDQTRTGSGLGYALAAFGIWGVLPLYLVLLNAVNPFELVGWRVVWTIPFCLAIVVLRGQVPVVRQALSTPAVMKRLFASGLLIGGNWLVFIVAVQKGYFYAASLGYYLNPMMNVVLGTIILKETLSRTQWSAVALALCGVAVLAWEAEATLIISLTLAVSFSAYGFIRKTVDVGSLPGLTIETGLLLVPAIALIVIAPSAEASFGEDAWETGLLMFAGVMTAVPLLFFAEAARRMRYSTLGFIQYLAPTMVFLSGLLLFDEELRSAQLICFVLIWTGIGLYTFDSLRMRRNQSVAAKRKGSPIA